MTDLKFTLKPEPGKLITFDDIDLTDRYELLSSLPESFSHGIEIGVWEAWYTLHMLQRTNMFIVGIDPWTATDSYEDVDPTAENFDPRAKGPDGFLWQETRYMASYGGLSKYQEFGGRWRLFRSFSHDIVHFFTPHAHDFIYIDGEHTYKAVSRDMADWWPKVKIGGILAGHDYNDSNPGTIKAVDEFAAKYNLEFKITGTNSDRGDAGAPSWVFIKGEE